MQTTDRRSSATRQQPRNGRTRLTPDSSAVDDGRRLLARRMGPADRIQYTWATSHSGRTRRLFLSESDSPCQWRTVLVSNRALASSSTSTVKRYSLETYRFSGCDPISVCVCDVCVCMCVYVCGVCVWCAC